jgi:aspartate/methionine/tyrosine aminotransferase
MNYSMAWYFDYAIERGAYLLDGSNLDNRVFPLYSVLRDELINIANGKCMELGYSYPGGKNELKELIALNESIIESTSIDKNEIVVHSGGATGALNNVFSCIKEKDLRRDIIVPTPVYPGILDIIKHNKLNPILIETKADNNFCITFEEVKDRINSNTLGIILTNPGNPACCYINSVELSAIIKHSINKDIYFIADSVFEEAPMADSHFKYFQLFELYDKFIKVKGLSKSVPLLNDIRLGWTICKNATLNHKLLEQCEMSTFSNSVLIERLTIVLLKAQLGRDIDIEKIQLFEK